MRQFIDIVVSKNNVLNESYDEAIERFRKFEAELFTKIKRHSYRALYQNTYRSAVIVGLEDFGDLEVRFMEKSKAFQYPGFDVSDNGNPYIAIPIVTGVRPTETNLCFKPDEIINALNKTPDLQGTLFHEFIHFMQWEAGTLDRTNQHFADHPSEIEAYISGLALHAQNIMNRQVTKAEAEKALVKEIGWTADFATFERRALNRGIAGFGGGAFDQLAKHVKTHREILKSQLQQVHDYIANRLTQLP